MGPDRILVVLAVQKLSEEIRSRSMNCCRGRTADTWAGFELVDQWMVLLLFVAGNRWPTRCSTPFLVRRIRKSLMSNIAGNGLPPTVAARRSGLGSSGAHAGRVEVDFNLGLGVGGFVVEVSGLVVPIADGGGDIREKGQGTVERLDVADVAVFIDGG
jgi:hypothetical protein